MTEAMLNKILVETQARKESGGEHVLSDGRRLTLYAASAGVPLTVTRVEAVRLLEGGTIQARNDKGERYFVGLGDVFAIATEGSGLSATARKAGFVG
jgi:uncharacterized cupin superfamily protein